MDLTGISKVMHTDSQDAVNRHLEEGWVVLGCQGGTDDEGRPEFWYALGFPGRPTLSES